MGQISSILDCERVRESVSASVDGELSQAEAAGVEAHLVSCESCRSYAAGFGETARLLRSAPLEELGFTIALPARRYALAHKVQVGAAAAAIAATVGLSALVGTLGSTRTSSSDAQALRGYLRANRTSQSRGRAEDAAAGDRAPFQARIPRAPGALAPLESR